MAFINIEIKARTKNSQIIRQWLLDNNAEFKGIDEQSDTYFTVPHGRLKLREGNIENNLIYYERKNQAGPKQSDFNLLPVENPAALKNVLSAALGIKIIVIKKREIYYIDNVKFHIDNIEGLGDFVEIEASNKSRDIPVEELRKQCDFYIHALIYMMKILLMYRIAICCWGKRRASSKSFEQGSRRLPTFTGF